MTPAPESKEGIEGDLKLRTSQSEYYNNYYSNKYGNSFNTPPNFPTKPYKNSYDYTDGGSMPERSGYGYGKTGYDRDDWSGDGCGYGGGGEGYGGGLLGGNNAIYLFTAGAFVTFILYRAIKDFETAAVAGKRSTAFLPSFNEILLGLEEFEEKIDRIADGKDTEDDSWISRIYNEFVGQYGDVDNELKDSDMDGLEPPLLDEKWGLSAAINDNTAKTTVDDSVPLNDDENDASRKKRDVHNNEVDEEVDEEPILSKGEEKCRVEMWRCMSKVVESSLHYMDNADGLMGFAKKTMFKMAFHGGLKNLWGGVMSIPEARSVQRCLTAHEECVSYEVLNREVTDSLDPQDPELEQVQDKMRNLNKKRRIIVNPEFAQSMDQSDGSEQYDEVIEEEDY